MRDCGEEVSATVSSGKGGFWTHFDPSLLRFDDSCHVSELREGGDQLEYSVEIYTMGLTLLRMTSESTNRFPKTFLFAA